jgi:multiple sugar transport system substrate-binding protein
LPVGYYNMDVMAKAGITTDRPAETGTKSLKSAARLHEAGIRNPMFWGWNITGNWFLQALMWSQDKATMEGNAFQISSDEGLKSLETMKKHLPRLRHEEH